MKSRFNLKLKLKNDEFLKSKNNTTSFTLPKINMRNSFDS